MSREIILNRIRSAKPAETPLPFLDVWKYNKGRGLEEIFIRNAESVGGKIIAVKNAGEIVLNVHTLFPRATEAIYQIEGVEAELLETREITSAHEIEKLDLAVIEGEFGVAENGAVWVPEKNFRHRSIPFIASHLIIVLRAETIVETMHDAALRISKFEEGYGVFISGPSKTADIEQSLVIGAQGPLSVTIFLLTQP